MPISREERRELKARLRSLLTEGATEQECAEELEIGVRFLRALLAEVLDEEVGAVAGDNPAQSFTRYSLRMEGCISDLDRVIANGINDTKSLNAVVGAVKAKAGIIDSIDAKGQKLGIIPSAPQKRDDLDGVNIADLTIADLKRRVRSKLTGLDQLASEAGGGGDYADEPDGLLYFDAG